MNSFPSFKNENKSHLFQENGEKMDSVRKLFLITCPGSSTKTKVIYDNKMAETWLEITKCYE